MDTRSYVDPEKNRGIFKLIGLIVSLSVVWVLFEWKAESHNPRQTITVAIPMHIEQISFRNETALLNYKAGEVSFEEAHKMLESYRPEPVFAEGQRMAYLKFRIDTAAAAAEFRFYNVGDSKFRKFQLRKMTALKPQHALMPLFAQNVWWVLPLSVPENAQR